MAQIPSRLVGDAQGPLELVGTHTLAGFAKQIGAKEPLHQRQVRIVENRSCCDAKIVVAAKTVVLLSVRYLRGLCMDAARAFDAVTPAQSFQIFAAFRFVAELLNQGAKINGVCHV